MNYVIGGTLATIVSSNVVNNIITNLITTIYGGTLFLRYGRDNNSMIEKYKNEIEEMDIAIKLEIIQNKLTSQCGMDKDKENEKNKSVQILGLLELIFKIKSIMENINYEIEKHNNKWFSSYRSVNISNKLNDLRHYVKILDNRIQLYNLNRL